MTKELISVKNLKNLGEKIKENPDNTMVILLIGILMFSLVSLGYGFSINNSLAIKSEEAKQASIPVDLELSIIDCVGCSDITGIVDLVKSQNVNIQNEEKLSIDDDRAQELISKYNIQNLPIVLVFGDIENEKLNTNNFEKINDALVFKDTSAPFLEISTNKLLGIVEIIEITDSSCEDCSSMGYIPLSLEQQGVSVGNWKKVEYNSQEGKNLILQYEIKHSPAILISDEVDYYPDIKNTLVQLGSKNKEGYYVLHSTIPPYRNLTTGEITGLVKLINIVDNKCLDCYDVAVNKEILTRLGIKITKEETYDVDSSKGKELISKYDIEKVPMIVISPEAEGYGSFVAAWKGVGSVENDGWYIMRTPERIGNITSLNSLKGDSND